MAKVKEGPLEAFGGNLVEIIVGGAPLNSEVESFLYRIGFPVTVGYGMTGMRTAYHLRAGLGVETTHSRASWDRMEVRIDSADPLNLPGNILVRGDNAMKGYYKNEKATMEVFQDNSGWMNTGDMGLIDEEGYVTRAAARRQ